jgi:hypothetical protein
LGTAVLGGMVVSTVMNLAIVPVLYIVVIELSERKKRKGPPSPGGLPPPIPPSPYSEAKSAL